MKQEREVRPAPHVITTMKHPRCEERLCMNPSMYAVEIAYPEMPRYRFLCSGHTEHYRLERTRWDHDQGKEQRLIDMAARRGVLR